MQKLTNIIFTTTILASTVSAAQPSNSMAQMDSFSKEKFLNFAQVADYEGLDYYAANYLGGYSHLGEANLIYPDNFGYHDYGEGSMN